MLAVLLIGALWLIAGVAVIASTSKPSEIADLVLAQPTESARPVTLAPAAPIALRTDPGQQLAA